MMVQTLDFLTESGDCFLRLLNKVGTDSWPATSITTRDGGSCRMAVIVRNQHTCIRTIARVAEATAGRGLSPYSKGAYHIMLVDRLLSLRMQARWPLPLDVLQYIARGGKTDKPYFLNSIGEQRCRLLIEQMPASRLRYEQAVICRKMRDEDDESGSDDEASHESRRVVALVGARRHWQSCSRQSTDRLRLRMLWAGRPAWALGHVSLSYSGWHRRHRTAAAGAICPPDDASYSWVLSSISGGTCTFPPQPSASRSRS